jgi:hypothetical protein
LQIASVHTLAQAKLDLAHEEAAEKKNGVITRHEMSPTNFILAVFDIEEKLYVLGLFCYSWELTKKHQVLELTRGDRNGFRPCLRRLCFKSNAISFITVCTRFWMCKRSTSLVWPH